MDYKHMLAVKIADTLEELQAINPVRYGFWYRKLYPPYGDKKYWTTETLFHLKNLLK